jgi:hypothetical protein
VKNIDQEVLNVEPADKKYYLIGPELFETYLLVLKIVVAVAVIGTIIGNTVAWTVNETGIIKYFASTTAVAFNAAIGAFGWITLVFAIIERAASEEKLAEIREGIRRNKPPIKTENGLRYFNRFGIFINILFIIAFMVLVNRYPQLIGFYFPASGIPRLTPILNIEVFNAYLPYVNGILILQLLLTISKLVLKKWTYGIATANLGLNVLSIILLFTIINDPAILNPDFTANFVTILQVNAVGVNPLEMLFRLFKALFIIALTLDSIKGFYNAYKNSRAKE